MDDYEIQTCDCAATETYGPKVEFFTNGDGDLIEVCAWCRRTHLPFLESRGAWVDKAVGFRMFSEDGLVSKWSTYAKRRGKK